MSEHNIEASGQYVLLMAQCNTEAATLYLEGSIVSLDPCKVFFLSFPKNTPLLCIILFQNLSQTGIYREIYLVICLFISR